MVELGRCRGKNDDRQCGDKSGSVVLVLWECPACDNTRDTFMGKLDNLLGRSIEEFSTLNNFNRTGLYFTCRSCRQLGF